MLPLLLQLVELAVLLKCTHTVPVFACPRQINQVEQDIEGGFARAPQAQSPAMPKQARACLVHWSRFQHLPTLRSQQMGKGYVILTLSPFRHTCCTFHFGPIASFTTIQPFVLSSYLNRTTASDLMKAKNQELSRI